jgi:acetyl-CoA synthetase
MSTMQQPAGSARPTLLHKDWSRQAISPNLLDYPGACSTFTWRDARGQLDGLPGGALNIAHEAVDRHVARGAGDHVALRWLGRSGERRDITYLELSRSASRFASVLDHLGVRPGDRVFSLAGRVPELYVAALGTLKLGAVFCPLFAAFGPEPIQARLAIGEGRVLVTTAALYARKIAGIRASLPALEHVILIDDGTTEPAPGTRVWKRLMAEGDESFPTAHTRPDTPALLHFTSGTTGRPKGALHVHEAVVAHHATGRIALDLHPGDIFWCTADPGWVTGTSYGIIAPLTHGITSVVDEGDLDAARWYGILEHERVTVWYTAPTAVRMLMRAGSEPRAGHDLSALRFVASVGEPLNPECVRWGVDVLGLPIHDNWWQTETGGILIANLASQDIKPGSMGRPLPGIEAAVVRRASDREVEVLDRPGEEGELAIRAGWPSMFRGYVHEDERYRKCFVGSWYLTGDQVRRDADGYYWFVARGDDVIKSAGHLIGPFEVESALLEHPAVAEAAAIGRPDPIVGEIVKAFVSLRPGHTADDTLRLDLIAWARRRLGPAVAPREIAFLDVLPHTRSGKLMRRLLRARDLGLPEGDTSTIESTP